jgi:hypothetical protein
MLAGMKRLLGRIGSFGTGDANEGDLALVQRRIAMNGGRDRCLALAKDASLTPKTIMLLAKRKLPDVATLLADHPAVTNEMAETMVRRGYATGTARARLVARFALGADAGSTSPDVDVTPVHMLDGPRDETPTVETSRVGLADVSDTGTTRSAEDDTVGGKRLGLDEPALARHRAGADALVEGAYLIGDEVFGGLDAPMLGAPLPLDDLWVPHATTVDEGPGFREGFAKGRFEGAHDDLSDLEDELYRLADELVKADELHGETDALASTVPTRDERVDRILADIFRTDVHGSGFAGLRARLASASPVGKLIVSIQRLLELGYDHDTILLAFDLRNEWIDRFGYQVKDMYLSWDTAVRLVESSQGATDVREVWAMVDAIVDRYNRFGGGASRTLGHYVARVIDDYHTSLVRGGHAPFDSIFG